MIITRRFGRILRGNATPFQLFSACFLASMIGFVPGLAQGTGLLLLWTLLLVVLNANLAMAALVGVGAKLASLFLMPVSFAVGRMLLDGPAQPFFQAMINAPILAFFGFEYYATTGGLVVGACFGLVSGLMVAWGITAFRRSMVALEGNSERFRQFTSKGWVKFLTWLLVSGGRGKATYEDLVAKTVGNPIRPLGVVFVLVMAALGIILYLFASGPIVVMALQSGLERANGASVEVADAELNLGSSRLTVSGLAMADPEALDTDRFRATKLEADINARDLFRKRLLLDRVVVSDARHGVKRSAPGVRIGPEPKPPKSPPPPSDVKSIDDYIREAKVWRERLQQAREWLEKISGEKAEEKEEGGAVPGTKEKKESLQERLEREVREKGYAHVTADHLIAGSPLMTISELVAEKVKVSRLPDETLDVTARNLSTHPRLLGRAPEVSIRSSAETVSFSAFLGRLGADKNPNTIDLMFRNLSTDAVLGQLIGSDKNVLHGGFMDITAKGLWNPSGLEELSLPLEIVMRDATVDVGGKPTQIQHLAIPIGVRGSFLNPAIDFDGKKFATALVEAGKAQAISELKTRAMDKVTSELNKQLGDKAGTVIPAQLGETVSGLFTNKVGSTNKLGPQLGDKVKALEVEEKGKQLLNRFLGGEKKDGGK